MTALLLDPAWLVLLDSRRMNAFHRYGTLHLALGDLAWEIERAHTALLSWLLGQAPQPSDADRAWFVESDSGWRLRDEVYFTPTPSIVDDDLALLFRRRDAEREVRVKVGREGLAFFGRLIPALRRTHPESALREALGPAAYRMVDQLVAQGILTRVPLQEPGPRAHRARLVAHSSILVESDGATSLVDPLLLARQKPSYNPLHPDLGWFDRPIDAVMITHSHWDHLTLDGLLHIDRGARVVLPAHRHADSIVNLDMTAVVRELSFTDVVELEPWASTTVGDQQLTALPYYGETFGPECPRDWLTWQIRAAGRNIVGLVDAIRDPFGDMDEVLPEVVRRFGPTDVLFAPVSGFVYPKSHFTRRPFYADTSTEPFTAGPADGVRWADTLQAKVFVPYALFHLEQGDAATDDAAAASDPFRTGTLADLRTRMDAPPAGPLAVLRPGDAVQLDDLSVERL